jgi:dephospho-CoA kinase
MSSAMRIGLTGGIGSGKSTVASLLAGLGAVIIDTDAIARQLTLPGGAAIDAISQAFGAEFVGADGALDRARMRQFAFADAGAKRRLESILHPLIGEETQRQATAAGDAVKVFDIPLLAESSVWRTRVDRVLVVDCSEAAQVARVMARSGWTRDAVCAVIAQQASRRLRRSIADAVIHNDGIEREQLAEEVLGLWTRWVVPNQGH